MPEDESSGGFTVAVPGSHSDESSGGFTIVLPGYEYTSSAPVTSPWIVMYNHLQTGTYALSTDNIFAAWNDKLIEDIGLPIIVIYPPDFGRRMLSMPGSLKSDLITFTIEVYHQKSENCKSLADELINSLTDGYSVFATAGLKRVRANWLNTVNYSAWVSGRNHRVHRYTIEANYRYTA